MNDITYPDDYYAERTNAFYGNLINPNGYEIKSDYAGEDINPFVEPVGINGITLKPRYNNG
jgi:hypothetical protein